LKNDETKRKLDKLSVMALLAEAVKEKLDEENKKKK
jgi:hypothetical protein